MNRYRFYEILQAHKKGEDLSAFVPKNAPEAKLIADLQGGAGGGSSVTSFRFNNPNIPNFYYGMCLNHASKITINIAKMMDFYAKALYGVSGEEHFNKVIPATGSAYGRDDDTQDLLYIGMTIGLVFDLNGITVKFGVLPLVDIPKDGVSTEYQLLEQFGNLELDLDELEMPREEFYMGLELGMSFHVDGKALDLNNFTAEDLSWFVAE